MVVMGFFDRKKPSKESASDEPQGGFLGLFKRGLEKTNQLLYTDVRDLFKEGNRVVDDAFLNELFAILIKTDMGAGPASEIREKINAEFRSRKIEITDALRIVKQELLTLMQQPKAPIRFATDGPTIILVVGVNGSGKTTSIAKLAQMCVSDGKSVVLGAADTFRAAAVQQLTIWAERIGAEIVKGEQASDPASVAHRATARALEVNADVCIIDTAGRLQTQTSLMQELGKIRRVINKQIPDAPHEALLVLDATAGQNGISQARGFSEAANCTGIVLAKIDGSAKGGVVIPIRQEFDLPVKYVGVGEQAEDLAVFNADEFVEAMFAEHFSR